MGFQNKGILGGFKGKVGPVVGRIYNGLNIISSRPNFKNRQIPLIFTKTQVQYTSYSPGVDIYYNRAIGVTGVLSSGFATGKTQINGGEFIIEGQINSFGSIKYQGLYVNDAPPNQLDCIFGFQSLTSLSVQRIRPVVMGVITNVTTPYVAGTTYKIVYTPENRYYLYIAGLLKVSGYAVIPAFKYLQFSVNEVGATVENCYIQGRDLFTWV